MIAWIPSKLPCLLDQTFDKHPYSHISHPRRIRVLLETGSWQGSAPSVDRTPHCCVNNFSFTLKQAPIDVRDIYLISVLLILVIALSGPSLHRVFNPVVTMTTEVDESYFNDLSRQPHSNVNSPFSSHEQVSPVDACDNSEIPKTKRIACVICRKRKLKCDGARPKCATCARLGHNCAYDEVRRKSGPKRGYVKELEARLGMSCASVC